MISSNSFYGEYHGHKIQHLEEVLKEIKKNSAQIIFLAGDSTLDNKFWFSDESSACNGYETILNPPSSRKDVTYCINKEIITRNINKSYAAINCAVEESSLGERSCGRLWPQDRFLRDNISENDIAVISVGGNDIALKANLCTILNLMLLHMTTTTNCLQNYTYGHPIPIDDNCCGCFSASLSNLFAWPPGFGYFLHLFKVKTESYIQSLLKHKKPKLILVCMLYYLDEAVTGSWADRTLSFLNYSENPAKVQTLLKRLYELAICSIRIEGCKVLPVPLFEALNGKISSDYCERVEPSAQGGAKMASLIIDVIEDEQKKSCSEATASPLFHQTNSS